MAQDSSEALESLVTTIESNVERRTRSVGRVQVGVRVLAGLAIADALQSMFTGTTFMEYLYGNQLSVSGAYGMNAIVLGSGVILEAAYQNLRGARDIVIEVTQEERDKLPGDYQRRT